ncbi:TetR/AcrR family transcriptional regulator [Nocardia brasiliensis]|uniref:TetR/AcrR family transcriptional regulator n=1 Tax=Nocardia brasiliensis TaxID=37326 RepID=UPI00245816DB|nr:helix-turn-helix domain-containing protein [Nocardia brasiliensis]
MTEAVGARAREKTRVRRELVAAALELFERQGYDRTPVEQIAAEAGVSARTFHRHFPAKMAVVFAPEEELIARLFTALRRRPADESPLTALRAAARIVFVGDQPESLRPPQVEALRRSQELLLANPQLRQQNFSGIVDWLATLAEHFAHRAAHPDDALGLQLAAAASYGALSVAFNQWACGTDGSIAAVQRLFDTTLDRLQHGVDP